MRKEICAEAKAMQILMRLGKKEATVWINKWMDIIEWTGNRDRIYYWGDVEKYISDFKITL